MDTVTYPSQAVRDVLGRFTVPLRLNVFQDREAARRFRVFWTPTFLYIDADGREYHRTMGWLPPEEFAAQLLVGVGLVRFQQNQFDAAAECFREAVSRFERSEGAAEATYWAGVCRFKKTKQTAPIYEACRTIVERFPGSAWAKKLAFVSKYTSFDLVGK